MNWSVILGLFDQAVPIGIVVIIIYMAIMSRDMRHIRKDLDNHITDTNKKIDKLENNMGTDLRDINRKIEKNTDKLSNLEAGQAELKTELRTGQAELKTKIDHLLSASK